ncbi:MAG: hypothetical protein VKK59_05325 [Vampirovibrionales bacterium]|nr:hypothetical protein [Vampirovibrionales bacterium]
MSTPTLTGLPIAPTPVGGPVTMNRLGTSGVSTPLANDQFLNAGLASRLPLKPLPLPSFESPAAISGVPLAQSAPLAPASAAFAPASSILQPPEVLAPGLFTTRPIGLPQPSINPMNPPLSMTNPYAAMPPQGFPPPVAGSADPAAGPLMIPRGLLTRRQDTVPGAETGTATSAASAPAASTSEIQSFLNDTAPNIEKQLTATSSISQVEATAKLMSLVDKEPGLLSDARARSELVRLCEIVLKTGDITSRQNVMYVLRKLPQGAGIPASLKAQIALLGRRDNPDDLSIGDAQALMRQMDPKPFAPFNSPSAFHLMNKPSWLLGQHFSGNPQPQQAPRFALS